MNAWRQYGALHHHRSIPSRVRNHQDCTDLFQRLSNEVGTANADLVITFLLDLAKKNKSFMLVYPNPSNKGLGVNVEVSIPENEIKGCEIEVTSLLGSIVKTIPLTSNKIHVSDINSGMYLFKLKSNNRNTYYQKVIIQ